MARRSSSSSRSSSRSSGTTRGASSAAAPPRPAPPAPVAPQQSSVPAMQQQQSSGGGGGGLMSTLGQAATWGVGMGVGSSVGHAIGNSAMGMFGGGSSSRDHVEQPQQPAYSSNQSTLGAGSSACETENKAFMRCLEANPNDMNACQFYLDMFKQCQAQSRQSWN